MLVEHAKIKELNKIQLEILKSIDNACKKLEINYYLIHGSLLGAVMQKGFIMDDDDIDIALFRDDYDKLLKYGQNLLPDYYFIQSNSTDKFPLEFSKVRDSRTTYVIDITKKINMNHGIFIDVFPIDYYPQNKVKAIYNDLRLKLLKTRISDFWGIKEKNIFKKTIKKILKLFIPSIEKAVLKMDFILKNVEKSTLIRITGGKKIDRGIPLEWFNDFVICKFEDMKIKIPKGYDKYLNLIYGDYKNTTLLEKKYHDEKYIELNSYILDFNESYKVKWKPGD